VPGEFSLSLAAFDLAWEHLGQGATPYMLDVPSVGRTMNDRARLREVEFRDLASRGLVNRGRLVAEVEDALVLLSRFDWAIDGVVAGEEPTSFRAAATDRSAVIARKDGELIHFTTDRPESLLDSVVSFVGDLKPGPDKTAEAMLARPRTRGGWFHVIRRDRNGQEAHPAVVSWFETDEGGYLAYHRPGQNEQPSITYTPADAARITHALRAAL
jgi:hypothetical protein